MVDIREKRLCQSTRDNILDETIGVRIAKPIVFQNVELSRQTENPSGIIPFGVSSRDNLLHDSSSKRLLRTESELMDADYQLSKWKQSILRIIWRLCVLFGRRFWHR